MKLVCSKEWSFVEAINKTLFRTIGKSSMSSDMRMIKFREHMR